MIENANDVSGIGSASTHTPVALEVPIPMHDPLCNQFNHGWEECNTKFYCLPKGCLRFGKKCYMCQKTFRLGQPEPGELAKPVTIQQGGIQCIIAQFAKLCIVIRVE